MSRDHDESHQGRALGDGCPGGIISAIPIEGSVVAPQSEPPRFTGTLPRGFGVRLDFPAPRDAHEYVELRRASAAHNRPWEPLRAGMSDLDQFRRIVSDANTKSSQRFFVRADSSRRIAGQVTLSVVRPGPARTAYIGYWTDASILRRGIATRAVLLSLDHAFDGMRLHRVEANVQPTNTASLALVRRVGFREEGLCRKYLEIAGAWRDHLRFSVLEEDWPAQRARLSEFLSVSAQGRSPARVDTPDNQAEK